MENCCEVLDRPKKYATDQSKSEESLILSKNVDFDILVFIQPTSPLILYSDINEGLEMMKIMIQFLVLTLNIGYQDGQKVRML